MKYFCLQACLFAILALCINTSELKAQDISRESEMKREFMQAKDYLLSFKNDSALIILDKLMGELSTADELNTPLGIKVQFRQAEALEKDHKDEVALDKLLHVVDISQEKEQWDILAHASLSLARLYEKIGRDSLCLTRLRQAESTIQKYELDSIYPRFSIRIASYHRIFSDVDSALFYAKEVLRTAPKFELYEEEAVGHMLMGMLTRDSAAEVRLGHYMAAAKTFKQVEDYTGYCYMIGSVAGWYYEKGDLRLALSYNDSSVMAATKSIAMGHEEYRSLWHAYKFRAEIFKDLGEPDSAWYYLKKGYKMELSSIHESNNEKVIEIDARYRDENKAQRIIEQEQQIKFETVRRNLLLGIIGSVLFFTGILSYYYLRLRKANQKTRAQTAIISKSNEALSASLQQQIMLQSEVHHRVKNNLQVIISLLELQMEDIDDPMVHKTFASMSNRIYSMAAIHEILYQQEDMSQVSLFDYAENLCMHFSNFSVQENKPVFDIQIENQYFNIETSMPLGVILTELLTNSLKYARREDRKLMISIGLEHLEDTYCFSYKDNGPGFSGGTLEEREGGLGTYLLKSMSRQLNGHLESKNEDGATYKIYFKEKNNPLSTHLLEEKED